MPDPGKPGNAPGVIIGSDMLQALGTTYREAPPEVMAAAELLIMAIGVDLQAESGAGQSKVRILHLALMQTQNAVLRLGHGKMSGQGFIDGIANYVAQALAIGPDEAFRQKQYDDFVARLAELWPTAIQAGDGAGRGRAGEANDP